MFSRVPAVQYTLLLTVSAWSFVYDRSWNDKKKMEPKQALFNSARLIRSASDGMLTRFGLGQNCSRRNE
jgi:hypothetical protein